jgi:outer membrane protein
MNRYKFLVALLAAAGFLVSTGAIASTPKIGVIDVSYVVAHSKRGKAANAALKALYSKKKASLDKQQASLKAKQADLKAEKNKKSSSFQKEVAHFRQSAGAFQQQVKKSQSAVQKRRSDLIKPIIKDLNKVLKDYANAHGYTLILNRTTEAVAYATPSTNLNDEIVQALDKYESQ